MKKIFFIGICLFMMVGCISKVTNITLDDQEIYKELIQELEQYNNSYTDNDYTQEELCIHPRGEFKINELMVEIWSEPHILHTYYVELKLKDAHAKIYFSPDQYNNILELLDSKGLVREDM